MSLFYFVRHGTNDFLPHRLAGRLPGVHLNEEGKKQAQKAAEALSSKKIERILSSPLERGIETAEPLAHLLKLPVEPASDFLEINFGSWAGLLISELDEMPQWKAFNALRSMTPTPAGEFMIDTQQRIIRKVEQLRREGPEATYAIFSHGDPIKLVFSYYLGIPIDLFTRIEISPASISVLCLHDWGPKIFGINDCSHLE